MKKKKPSSEVALTQLEQIKKLVIIAMFSDDELMDYLVLKGGNALDIVHRISTRASVDVDFSMEKDFPEGLESLHQRVERTLRDTFRGAGYEVFDVKMEEKPAVVTPDMADFWGGYGVEFKLIEKGKYEELSSDLGKLRRNAVQLGQGPKFLIDISRFEYTTGKERQDLDGYRIFVYSPEMMVCEKLRAICQQMPEYELVVKRGRPGTPRARDFVDIHTVVTGKEIVLTSEKNMELLTAIFAAKRVELSLLGKIKDYRGFHGTDFPAVTATVKAGVKLKDFDFYFDFVLSQVEGLKPLWDV